MRSFTYRAPTEVVFGEGAELQTVELIKRYGGSRILVLYGGGSAKRSGLLDNVLKMLQDAGLAFEVMGGIKTNPGLIQVREGIQKALAMKADFFLPIGGGSVIDAAKAMAHGTANPGIDPWLFWSGEVPLTKTLPVGAILTIPAAGSETSFSCVITNEEKKSKNGFNTEFNRPVFAIINPVYAMSTPRFHLASGITDIMMHTLDRYINKYFDNETTDELAEAVMRVVIRNGKKIWEDPNDLHAMSEILWSGSLSHNQITGLGGTRDFTVHMFGHELSAKFDFAHGASMACAWTGVCEYIYRDHPERFAQYARNVWGITQEGSDEELALAGIRATADFFRSMDMPIHAPDFLGRKMTEEEILDLALRCSNYKKKTVGHFKVLAYEDMVTVFRGINGDR